MTPAYTADISALPAVAPAEYRPDVELMDPGPKSLVHTIPGLIMLLHCPIPLNCWVVFVGIEALAGDIDVNTDATTFTLVVPVILPLVAIILQVPILIPVANPPLGVIITMLLFEDDHVIVAVIGLPY